MKPSDRPAGFTLTELLVVLLIIGILVAIAVPNYMKFIKKVSRESREDVHNIIS